MDRTDRAFLGVATSLFVGCAAITVSWCTTMAAMGAMPMPGNWTMSMTWMRMPGQSWPGAAASFVAMWIVMMTAMMLPSLVPALLRYRRAVGDAGTTLDWLTALAALGYFSVWILVGAGAFPLGAVLAGAEMQSPALARAVPLAVSIVVLIAGALQFTRWKARQLSCCREVPIDPRATPADARFARRTPVDAASALNYGLRLGVRCSRCCAGLTAILLVVGVMDLRAMAVLTTAITLERVLPFGVRVAHAVGVATVGVGLALFWAAISFAP